jgi:hypothetical protein
VGVFGANVGTSVKYPSALGGLFAIGPVSVVASSGAVSLGIASVGASFATVSFAIASLGGDESGAVASIGLDGGLHADRSEIAATK